MGCTYFDSPDWRDHLVTLADEVLTVRAFLASTEGFADAGGSAAGVETGRRRLRAALPDDVSVDEALLDRGAAAVVAEADAEALGRTVDDVVDLLVRRGSNDRSEPDLPADCPHPTESGDRCAFHGDASPETVRAALHEALSDPDPDRHAVVGARLDALDLAGYVHRPAYNRPVDLRFSIVEGRADLTDAQFRTELRLDACSVGSLHARGATLDGRTRFAASRVHGDAGFRRTTFGGDAWFRNARFDGSVGFGGARFDGEARFSDVRFEGGADYTNASFAGRTWFDGVYAGRRDGPERRRGREPMADLRFADATFRDGVSMAGATLVGDLGFRRADIQGDLDCSGLQPGPDRPANERVTVDCTGAAVDGGRLDLPDDERVVMDWTDGAIADVTIAGGEDDGDGAVLPFDRLLVARTSFDGFAFEDHRGALGETWNLHRLHDPGSGRAADTGLAPKALESTYLKARRGADATGDRTAASQFFVREMRYRRRLERDAARTGETVGDRTRARAAWLANGLFALSCGYGERPRRTVLLSLLLVLGYGAVFAALGAATPPEAPLGAVVSENLTFSLQSFVSLIFGGVPRGATLSIRLLASSEGFLGGFLIALFVFALTRSVQR
jgi:hypothetical protein